MSDNSHYKPRSCLHITLAVGGLLIFTHENEMISGLIYYSLFFSELVNFNEIFG